MRNLDWARAPTAYRLITGDAPLRIIDPQPHPPALVARIKRWVAHRRQSTHARKILFLFFGRSRSYTADYQMPGFDGSTTRVIVEMGEAGPTLFLKLWNGRDMMIATYDHHPWPTYAVGYQSDQGWLWSSELSSAMLVDETRGESRLVARVFEMPAAA